MADVWRRQVYSTEQQVLLILCDHANDDGANCYPSVPLIAWKIGVSDRTVRRVIKELERTGVLGITRIDGKANQYRIHLDALPIKEPLTQLCHPRKNVTPDTAMSGHPGHNSVTPTPDTAMSSEPSIEPSITTTQGEQPSNVVHVSPPPPKPSREKKRPEHGPAQRIMAAFCDAVGIERLPNYDRAGGIARNLVSSGVTAEDIPDMVAWCFEQEWLKGGIDLDTLYRNVVRWKTDRMERPKRKGGPPVDLLPGETATDMGNGEWEMNHPSGYKRVIKPSYHGVIWDTRKHTGYDGMQAFNAAVEKARAKAERNEVAA